MTPNPTPKPWRGAGEPPLPELSLYRLQERILREAAAPYGVRARSRPGWIERLRRWWRRLWGR
jgi:hypothetical protein